MMNSAHNPNRSLVRIFGLASSGLLLVYSMIAVYGLFELENISAAELAVGVVRIALGPLALLACSAGAGAPIRSIARSGSWARRSKRTTRI